MNCRREIEEKEGYEVGCSGVGGWLGEEGKWVALQQNREGIIQNLKKILNDQIKALLIYVIYMNLNKINRNCQPNLIFHDDEASPYLSPLLGLNSPHPSFSEHDLLNFTLEDGNPHHHQPNQQLKSQQFEDSSESPPLKEMFDDQKGEEKDVPTQSQLAKASQSKVQSIIRLLVENDKLSEAQLKGMGWGLCENMELLQYVFQTLMTKFKRLKKTKEEMTKYCMRKAFKFVNDAKKSTKNPTPSSKKDTDMSQDQFEFQLPFKKNSSQKTMNNQFLRQIFTNKEFATQYHNFLGEVHKIIEEDNDGKIIYLSNMIEGLILSDQIKKVEGIKRLPWTQTILKKTEDLAFSMVEFTEGNEEVLVPKAKKPIKQK